MAVALRQLNPIHKKGAIKFFLKKFNEYYMRWVAFLNISFDSLLIKSPNLVDIALIDRYKQQQYFQESFK